MKTYKKLIVVFFLLGFSFGGLCLAQLKKNALRFEILSEKEHAKEIMRVIYGEKKINDETKLYPQIIEYRGKELAFFDENENLLNIEKFDDISVSPCENYVCLLQWTEYIEDIGPKRDKYLVFNRRGKKLWEKEYELKINDNFYPVISDKNGSVVRIGVHNVSLSFLDSTGSEINNFTIFDDVDFGDERRVNGKFSEDGEYFAVFAEKRMGDYFKKLSNRSVSMKIDTSPIIVEGGKAVIDTSWYKKRLLKKDKSTEPKPVSLKDYHPSQPPLLQKIVSAEENLALILYTSTGQELWRYYLDLLYPDKVKIAKNGDYIIMGSYGFYSEGKRPYGLYLLNKEGTLIKKIVLYRDYERSGIMDFQFTFSKDNLYCMIGNANWVLMMETATGLILWKKEFPWEISSKYSDEYYAIKDIKWFNAEHEEYVIIESLGRRRKAGDFPQYFDAEFILLDSNGNTIQNKKIKIHDGGPAIESNLGFQISPGGHELIFDLGNKITRLKLK